jgi:hypothetical protein
MVQTLAPVSTLAIVVQIYKQGSIFRSENNIYSTPPSDNEIFPLLRHIIFQLLLWPI